MGVVGRGDVDAAAAGKQRVERVAALGLVGPGQRRVVVVGLDGVEVVEREAVEGEQVRQARVEEDDERARLGGPPDGVGMRLSRTCQPHSASKWSERTRKS
jgi:hypothetical protein